jgi:hypothetical protein
LLVAESKRFVFIAVNDADKPVIAFAAGEAGTVPGYSKGECVSARWGVNEIHGKQEDGKNIFHRDFPRISLPSQFTMSLGETRE